MAGCAVWLVSSFTSLARAEEPAPAANAVQAAPADVVRLKSGGLLRGTISELVPHDSVTIVTVSGQTRTFPMAEVEYAGPASEAPSKAAPAPPVAAEKPNESKTKPYVTVNGAEAHLHLESEPEGLTFHRQSGSATAVGYGYGGGMVATAEAYDRLCTAPCDVTLPAGAETLALSRPNGKPVVADAVAFPAGKSRVVGTLESRKGLRIAGIVVLAVGGAAGLATMVAGLTSRSTNENGIETRNTTLVLAGSGIVLGSTLAGTILLVQRDRATITVGHNYVPPLPTVTGLAFSGTL